MTTIAASSMRQAHPGFLERQGIVDLDLRLVVYTVWMSLATAVFKEVVGADTLFYVGSYNLTVVEPVVVLQLLSIAALAARRPLQTDLFSALALGMAGLVFINLFRGIGFEAFSAIRSFRIQGAFALYLVMVVFIPRDEALLRQIRNALIVFGLVLCALLLVRLMFGAQLFIRQVAAEVTEINDGGRPVSADGALMIGAALILAVSRLIEDRTDRRMRWVVGVLFVALIYTAQATATISSLLGLVVITALHPSTNRGGRVLLVVLVGLLAAVGYFALNGAFGRISLSFLPEYFQYNLLRRSTTIEVRHLIWAGLMENYAGWPFLERLIGLRNNDLPYIYIPLREGYYWWASIHSMYYGALVFMGSAGLTMYIVTLVGIFLRGLATAFGPARTWSHFGGAIPLAMLAAFGLFGHSYELRDEHTLLIILAIVACRPLPDRAADVPLQGQRGNFVAKVLPKHSRRAL